GQRPARHAGLDLHRAHVDRRRDQGGQHPDHRCPQFRIVGPLRWGAPRPPPSPRRSPTRPRRPAPGSPMSSIPDRRTAPVVRPATALAGRTTTRRRRLQPLVPYALLAPALLVLAAILGFPMYRLVSLSFQQYGLKELFAGRGTFIGLRNYQDILT